MRTNIKPFERAIRVVGGGVLFAIGMQGGNYWFLLGLIPLATGLIGWCPPYALLGINKNCEV